MDIIPYSEIWKGYRKGYRFFAFAEGIGGHRQIDAMSAKAALPSLPDPLQVTPHDRPGAAQGERLLSTQRIGRSKHSPYMKRISLVASALSSVAALPFPCRRARNWFLHVDARHTRRDLHKEFVLDRAKNRCQLGQLWSALAAEQTCDVTLSDVGVFRH